MECGADELACHLIDWALNSPYVVKEAFDAFDVVWKQTGWHIGEFLQKHGEKLIAIFGFCFAVWKWLRYREGILHKRLQEFIRESDARLGPACAQIREAILRPGRTAVLPQPAFAIELRGILNTHGWWSFFNVSPVEKQVERKLGRVLRRIHRREQVARKASRSLEEQRAQVHLLAGAVAAARAQREYDCIVASRNDHKALRQFQEVLQFTGHHRDAIAKEAEAFQLLRLGQRAMAKLAYEEVERFAADIEEQRTRDLIIARSMRFRAQITQAEANGAGSFKALKMIAGTRDGDGEQNALALRRFYVPHNDWDAIEQGEMHYVAAYIANRLSASVIESQQISEAANAYKEALNALPARSFLITSRQRRLREEAEAGLRRVERTRSGDYDQVWLMV